MPQIQGIKGEAVVVYCESLITKEMGYHRLSIHQGITILQVSEPFSWPCFEKADTRFVDRTEKDLS